MVCRKGCEILWRVVADDVALKVKDSSSLTIETRILFLYFLDMHYWLLSYQFPEQTFANRLCTAFHMAMQRVMFYVFFFNNHYVLRV